MGLSYEHALVTGASGFLGSRLTARLRAEGVAVTGTTRDAAVAGDGVGWRSVDLRQEAAVRRLFQEERPDVVFHLAGHVSGAREPENVSQTLGANLVSAVNVLLAGLETGCRRVVLAGSYEEPEGAAPPRSPYAAAKAAATAYARLFASLYGLSAVVLRPAMVYGPGQRDETKLVPYVTRAFLGGTAPLLSSGDRQVDWVYVDDVVDAFVVASTLEGLEGAVIDVGSGELHAVREVVELLARETQTSVEPRFGGLPDRAFEHQRAADTGMALRLLGWKATTLLRTGLARTVEAMRADAPGSRLVQAGQGGGGGGWVAASLGAVAVTPLSSGSASTSASRRSASRSSRPAASTKPA